MMLWRRLFARRRLERVMDEEMRFHLEMRAAHNVAAGMRPEDAGLAARRQFGHVDGIKERCRDQAGWVWLEGAFKDIRHAFRTMTRTPAQACMAALTLALGIGLATVQLSVVHAVFVKSLPFARPDRIVVINLSTEVLRMNLPMQVRDYTRWRGSREAHESLEASGAYVEGSVNLSGSDLLARSYRGAALSADVLPIFGVRPLVGRGFLAEDDRPGAPAVVLIGHGVWRRDFGGDPRVVGRKVRLGGKPATIVGVMPSEFSFPERGESWANLGASTPTGQEWVSAIGRLKDGVTRTAAEDYSATSARNFELPELGIDRPLGARRLRFRLWEDAQVPRQIRALLLTLLGVAAGVLALASVNVATLLLVRALARGHELALRQAIGASRRHLVRQILIESLTLALVGGLGGALIAWLGVPLLDRLVSADAQKPDWVRFELNGAVLAMTSFLTLIVGLAAGVLPALRATRLDVIHLLKDKSASTSLQLGKITRGLTTAQIAAASMLLVIIGVLAAGITALGRNSLPFDASGTLSASLDAARYTAPGKPLDQFRASLLERVEALPGVEAATLADHHPWDQSTEVIVEVAGASGGDSSHVFRQLVAANYLEALDVPFREGRSLAPDDRGAVVINESLARRYWPGRSAIGGRFREADPTAPGPWLTVVGVVADLPLQGVLGTESPAGYYAPLTSESRRALCLLLRCRVPPLSLARPLREAVRELAPDLPVDGISTVAEFADRRLATVRSMALLGLVFGAGALFLAAMGVYAVTAFTADQRSREVGIRVALGASARLIVALVLRGVVLQGGFGLAAGLLLGHVLSRPLAAAMRPTIGTAGVEVYATVAAVVAAAMLASVGPPARRSLKVDPARTLQAE